MTHVLIETTTSYQASESDGKTTASRSFVAYDDNRTELTIKDAFSIDGMPQKFDPHPQLNTIYAISYDLSKVEGIWAYEITWNYAALDSTDQEEQPGEPGYEEFSSEIAVQYRDAWRTDTDSTAIIFPTSGDPNLVDIAGTKVDSGGEPISQGIQIQSASFSKIVEGFPNLTASRILVGLRNNAQFLGANIGTLVYAGASVERTDANLYRVTHQMHFDNYAHLHQVPEKEEDGNPKLNTDFQAEKVVPAAIPPEG